MYVKEYNFELISNRIWKTLKKNKICNSAQL